MAVHEDRLDALDDESLIQLLSTQAGRRRERLHIEKRGSDWVAESYQPDGLSSGRSVMLGATGTDRRSAMLGLARKFEDNRW
jgi:hypothetical protein